MSNNCFFLKKIFNAGWSTFVDNLGFLTKLSLILTGLGIISFLLVLFFQTIVDEIQWLKFLYIFLVALISIIMVIFYMQAIKMSLDLLERKPFVIKDFFSVPKNILPFIIGLFLCSLIAQAGTLLLIVPGIIWSLKFSMVPFLIVDKNLSAVEALKESARLTQGVKLKLLGFWMVIGCLSLLTFIPVVMFLCLFFVMLCFANIYAQLKDSSREIDKV